jgi:hypothetical protein
MGEDGTGKAGNRGTLLNATASSRRVELVTERDRVARDDRARLKIPRPNYLVVQAPQRFIELICEVETVACEQMIPGAGCLKHGHHVVPSVPEGVLGVLVSPSVPPQVGFFSKREELQRQS